MCVPGSRKQGALKIVETLYVLCGEVHWFSAFARGGNVVDRSNQRGLLVNDIAVKVNKAKKRLQFANSCVERPVSKHGNFAR